MCVGRCVRVCVLVYSVCVCACVRAGMGVGGCGWVILLISMRKMRGPSTVSSLACDVVDAPVSHISLMCVCVEM